MITLANNSRDKIAANIYLNHDMTILTSLGTDNNIYALLFSILAHNLRVIW